MTQDPALSAEKVAELEKRLADAAAEVAKVQAQLTQAKHGADPPPTGTPLATDPPAVSSGRPGTAIPPVPYGDAQMTPVDIQAVIAGQLNSQLSPQALAQLHSVMSRLGLDQTLGPVLGLPVAPANPPSPTSVAQLAEPPRSVPATWRLATFDFSWWEFFVLAMLGVAPIALWGLVPESRPIGLVVIAAGVVAFRARRYLRRIRILKWGKVATVTNSGLVDRGSYHSGTTYNNMRLRAARGWTATTQWYSGPGHTTDVSYSLDGTTATLRLKGLPYVDGVILADSRKPTRAMCVSQFPYDLTPQQGGSWSGALSSWKWLGIILTLVIETTLVTLAVLSALEAWA